MEKLKMRTIDYTDNNIEKIGQLFPNCLTEQIGADGQIHSMIDFDILRQELSKDIVEGNQERYQFTWPDKKRAIRLANTPSSMTLRPCREESVDFDNTENLYVEGDNLEVLKLLRENYLGKVKMIYIDPPYNTGNDFVYEDNFAQSVEAYSETSGQTDTAGNRMVLNLESNGRFHTDWLNMIYPRLKVARDLLEQEGIIIISIDDNEQDNLRKVCDEIFGPSNFIATFIWQQGKKSSGNLVGVNHEYAIAYAKNLSLIDRPDKQWRVKKEGLDKIYEQFRKLKSKFGDDNASVQRGIRDYFASLPENDPAYGSKHYNYVDDKGLFFADNSCAPDRPESRSHRPLIHPITGKPTAVPSLGWRWNDATLDKLVEEGRIFFGDNETVVPKVKKYLSEMEYEMPSSVFYKDGRGASKRLESLFSNKVFDFPKDEFVIERFINMIGDKKAIVLDFFSGSSTTAHAVMQLNSKDGGNRKFIMVQLPEGTDLQSEAYKAGYKDICAIGKERIRRAGILIQNEIRKECDSLSSQIESMAEAKPSFSAGLFGPTEQNKIFEKAYKENAQPLKDKLDELEERLIRLDTGFRVLKLDSSNMKDVYYRPEDSSEQTLFEDNVKPDRTGEDLLFQVMLECNLPLSAKIQTEKIAGKEVFSVNNGYLIACFDEDVNEEVITAVAKRKPYYFIMRDKSLSSDNVADNFEQIFKAYSKDTIRRII